MADFNFVNSRLATGAAITSSEDAIAIMNAGITHILDVTDGGDDTPLFLNMPNVHVLWNPTADDGTHKDSTWFKTSLDFALPALVIPNSKIYAHCSAGVNRGPSTCYAILRALGFSPEQSEGFIRGVRPQVGLAYIRDADQAIQDLGYL